MGDRFIPSRKGGRKDVQQFNLTHNTKKEDEGEEEDTLKKYLFGMSKWDTRVLPIGKCHNEPHDVRLPYQPELGIIDDTPRRIPCERVLDAPGVKDNFYNTILDWSVGNILSVALGESIYLYRYQQEVGTDTACTRVGEEVLSVSFSKDGTALAIGTALPIIYLYDIQQSGYSRVLSTTERVVSIDWSSDLLACGSMESTVIMRDIRCPYLKPVAGILSDCGSVYAKWSPSESKLAVGCNNNRIGIYDRRKFDKPLHLFDYYNAAVKAMDWCPWMYDTLATGGGNADPKLCIWDIARGELKKEILTPSQIPCIKWGVHHKEIIVGHSRICSLEVRDYKKLNRITELNGHKDRVLSIAMSPDASVFASIGSNEEIRFWRLCSPEKIPKKENHWIQIR